MANASAADVAVCFSGWLAVRVPQQGARARKHLVDVLGADVLVAGTFLPSDCGSGYSRREREAPARTACLLRRLEGLRPFARVRVDPMLTKPQLRRLVSASPNWPRVSSAFREENTMAGVTIWAPLLGNGNLSVLRELHDYSRVLSVLKAHERIARAGRPYKRVVFSRLEFEWLADHPPISLLPSAGGVVWLPSGGVSSGLNDRHALMDRAAADVYFRRWELLFSPRLFQIVPSRVVMREGPELLLLAALAAHRLRVRYFPSTMMLGCCGRRSLALRRCYGLRVCITRTVRLRGGRREVTAKYFDELKFAERHAAALSCPGARFAPVGGEAWRKQEKRSAYHREPAVVIVLPAPTLSLWHPERMMNGSVRASAGGAGNGMLRFTLPTFTTFVRPEPMAVDERAVSDERAAGAAVRHQQPQPAAYYAALRALERLALAGAAAPLTAPRRQAPYASSRLADLADRLSPCPLLPRNWWPAGAVSGFCAETSGMGDCANGDKGTFDIFEKRGLFRGELVSIGECARMCATCARCRYISVAISPDATDCSWYHSCDLSRTRQLPNANFVSMSLRSAQAYSELCQARYGKAAC